MNFTYYKFLMVALMKRKATWIIGGIYILFTLVFLCIVPAMTHRDPFFLWGNINIAPQTVLMYVGALYAAVQSIAIFKEHRDNGSELIVVSKPINRIKIISTKFCAYITFCLFFGCVSLLFMLFVLCFSDVTGTQVGGLMLSAFLANTIFMLIFGFLATFTSIFLNKLWTILINIIMIVLLVIYTTVCMATVKSTLELSTSNGNPVTSTEYISREKKAQPAVIVAPKMDVKLDINAGICKLVFQYTDVPSEHEAWEKIQNSSKQSIVNFFDFNSQFSLMNNAFGLRNSMQDRASRFFGENRWYDYHLGNQPIAGTNKEPLFYVKSNWNIPNDDDPDRVENVASFIMNFLLNSAIVLLGDTEQAATPLQYSAKRDKLVVAEATEGYSGSSAVSRYTYDDLKVDDNSPEGIIFAKIYDDIIEDADSRVTSPEKDFVANHGIGTSNISFNAKAPLFDCLDERDTGHSVWDYMHYVFVENKQELGIVSLEDMMKEILKFKMYVFIKGTEYLNKTYINNPDNPEANCNKSLKLTFPGLEPQSLPFSPLLPWGQTDVFDVGAFFAALLARSTDQTAYDFNAYNSYFSDGTYYGSSNSFQKTWAIRALLDWATYQDSFGYGDIDNLQTPDYIKGYSTRLCTHLLNFPLLYGPFMTDFTAVQRSSASFINIGWLSVALIIGIVVGVLYWRMDFK